MIPLATTTPSCIILCQMTAASYHHNTVYDKTFEEEKFHSFHGFLQNANILPSTVVLQLNTIIAAR